MRQFKTSQRKNQQSYPVLTLLIRPQGVPCAHIINSATGHARPGNKSLETFAGHEELGEEPRHEELGFSRETGAQALACLLSKTDYASLAMIGYLTGF